MMTDVTVGPVQLVVLGFKDPDFRGRIREEINAVKARGIIMPIKLEFFCKNKDGDVRGFKESGFSEQEQAEFSALVSALIGGDAGGKESIQSAPAK